MTKVLNIRNEADRAALEAGGYRFVTVFPGGANIGQVVSRHRSYSLAEKAAKNRDLAIRDVLDTTAGAR